MCKLLARIEDIIAGSALTLFSFAVVLGVFYRYALDSPLAWTNEISLIAFAWLIFVGAAICARTNEHIIIDLLNLNPNLWTFRGMETIAMLIAAITSLILAWVTYQYTLGASSMVTPVFRLSSAVYNAAAPAGFILMSIHFIAHIHNTLTKNTFVNSHPDRDNDRWA